VNREEVGCEDYFMLSVGFIMLVIGKTIDFDLANAAFVVGIGIVI
jgi:hypothetical protein